MPWNKDGTRKSAFYLKSGNSPLFKQVGSSPLKQDKVGTMSAVNKEITRVAKGGKVQADLIKEAAKEKAKQKTTTKTAKKTTTKAAKTAAKKSFDKWMLGIIKKGGTRAMGTIGAYFGSMKGATATQPGTSKHGGKRVKKYNPKTEKYEQYARKIKGYWF